MPENIHCLTTDTSITLWWEKPDPAPAEYRIFMDDGHAETVSKTHVTLDRLMPDHTYKIHIEPVNWDFTVHTSLTKRRLDVTKAPYFALGDGNTMNTKALQQAFDDCGKNDAVYLPAGIYMTGALRLHSNMELYLDEGAVLQGTDQIEDYLPRIKSRFEGAEMECYSSLLNLGALDHSTGPNCENVLIHGHGTIASGGQSLGLKIIENERIRLKDYLDKLGEKIKECENEHTIPGRVRPRLINLSNCRNVRISGITLENGACWNVHMIYCDNITTDHCIFRSEGVWNGDGWDPDSSVNCTLFASKFYTGDDAVAIKSGKNPEGNVIGRPSEHIRVFDCYSAFGHGICIGSEMSGGVNDVKIWDCDLKHSMSGLEIKGTKKRGGYVRNIQVQDCILPRIQIHAVGYNDDGIGAPEPPVFEDCLFKDLYLTGFFQDCHGDGKEHPCPIITLEGFDTPGHAIRNVTFQNITLAPDTSPNMMLSCCEGIHFDGIKPSSRNETESVM